MSLCIYQLGTWFTTGTFGIGAAVALLVIALFIYLMVRPYREGRSLTARLSAGKAV